MLDFIKHPCLKCLVRPACKNLDKCDICKKYKEIASKASISLSITISTISTLLLWFIIIKYTNNFVIGVFVGVWVIGGITLSLLLLFGETSEPSNMEFYLYIAACAVLGLPFLLMVALNIYFENLTSIKT